MHLFGKLKKSFSSKAPRAAANTGFYSGLVSAVASYSVDKKYLNNNSFWLASQKYRVHVTAPLSLWSKPHMAGGRGAELIQHEHRSDAGNAVLRRETLVSAALKA